MDFADGFTVAGFARCVRPVADDLALVQSVESGRNAGQVATSYLQRKLIWQSIPKSLERSMDGFEKLMMTNIREC